MSPVERSGAGPRQLAAAVVAVLVLFLAAAAADARTLTFCSAGTPEGFDPAPFTTAGTFDAAAQIYDRLVSFEPGTTRPAPGLAERWDVSPDGLRYTFHLRPGVKFHSTAGFAPTRDLNADDVIFSLERQMRTDNPWYGYAGGAWPYAEGLSLGARIKEFVRDDDLTVSVVLERPDATLPAVLALDFAAILSKEYADRLVAEGRMERLGTQPVGTGPFRLGGMNGDGRVRFMANDAYWGGRPKLDELDFLLVPDPRERLSKLRAGECQVAADLEPAAVAEARKEASLSVSGAPALDLAYLAFNTTLKPFDDAGVRRALSMAIDRQAIVDTVYGGEALAARGPLPPAVWAADKSAAAIRHDPETAMRLLADAGVNGLTLRIWTMPEPRPFDPDPKRLAEMIAADFAKIGVAVSEIESPPWPEFVKSTAARDRDGVVLYGWTGDTGDPDEYLGPLLGCDGVGSSNRAIWCDPRFQDAIIRARATPDPAERVKLYDEAQKLAAEEAPIVPLVHTRRSVAFAKGVTGVLADPFGRHRFAGADIAE
jgi:dipeptide transport system substrate-binding protein